MLSRPAPSKTEPGSTRREAILALSVGFVLLTTGYVLAFVLAGTFPVAEAIVPSLRNSVPAFVLAAIVHSLCVSSIWSHSTWPRLAMLVPLGLVYTFLWYFLVLTSIGAREGWLAQGFSVIPFSGPAFAWQMFQGVTLYFLVVLMSYVLHLRRELASAHLEPSVCAVLPERALMFQRDGEIVAIEPGEMVRLSGADDYVEVVTRTQAFLSSGTLTDLEAQLDETRFGRVHRSHIVHYAAITRAEPAGNGRMTLHLTNGDSVLASRNGTRLLRERAF